MKYKLRVYCKLIIELINVYLCWFLVFIDCYLNKSFYKFDNLLCVDKILVLVLLVLYVYLNEEKNM